MSIHVGRKMAFLSIDRAMRAVFPSTSRLTFNPFFRAIVNCVAVLPRFVYPEFRKLPPNHLRIRVGAGNMLFNNEANFLIAARNFWFYVLSAGIVTLESNVLDIGVGCGRWPLHLRDLSFRGHRFSGIYVGIDIDAEAIEWCKQNFDAERFRFHISTDPSISYATTASADAPYQIPEADEQFDLVFSTSLFTHLLEKELENYLGESYRLVKQTGTVMHYHNNLDFLPPTYGTRHTFAHTVGNARVESLVQPEAAVAYATQFLFDMSRTVGFRRYEILRGPEGDQPVLLCRK